MNLLTTSDQSVPVSEALQTIADGDVAAGCAWDLWAVSASYLQIPVVDALSDSTWPFRSSEAQQSPMALSASGFRSAAHLPSAKLPKEERL